ncbi:MAG: IscS subfamily cysteine desulfurase [Planctomycetota bacterium]|nr:IscS subfamily cysteine desulfurase [Planctomycetota bacterium]
MAKMPIYLDNHATTPMDPRVFEAMTPYFLGSFGNAASRNHAFGWVAEKAVETAREQIAALIGANSKEIVFTSGATESDNIAIKGVIEMYAEKGNHIITAKTEHKAVLDTCKYLERLGKAEVTYLDPDTDGRISVESIQAAITDKTVLIAVMAANNEIGTIAPLKEIGALAKEKGIFFFTDAAQAVGRIPLDVNELGIDIMAISGHKIYGPKGIGALYVRRRRPRVRLTPVIHGGGHERGMRSGTLPVPLCVGLGKACEIAGAEMEEENKRIIALREKLHQGILEKLDYVSLNGHPEHRLPNNLNISFAYVEGEGLMMAMKDLAVSSGSACTSASLEPSYVLKALGVGDELAHSSIRYGLGRFTTEEEIDFAITQSVEAVSKLREMSPLYEMAQEGIDLATVQWQVPHE